MGPAGRRTRPCHAGKIKTSVTFLVDTSVCVSRRSVGKESRKRCWRTETTWAAKAVCGCSRARVNTHTHVLGTLCGDTHDGWRRTCKKWFNLRVYQRRKKNVFFFTTVCSYSHSYRFAHDASSVRRSDSVT